MLFTILPESYAVLVMGGVYRQAHLYSRDGYVYAAYGSGFVGLRRDNATTHPKIRYTAIVSPLTFEPEKPHGALMVRAE